MRSKVLKVLKVPSVEPFMFCILTFVKFRLSILKLEIESKNPPGMFAAWSPSEKSKVFKNDNSLNPCGKF